MSHTYKKLQHPLFKNDQTWQQPSFQGLKLAASSASKRCGFLCLETSPFLKNREGIMLALLSYTSWSLDVFLHGFMDHSHEVFSWIIRLHLHMNCRANDQLADLFLARSSHFSWHKPPQGKHNDSKPKEINPERHRKAPIQVKTLNVIFKDCKANRRM